MLSRTPKMLEIFRLIAAVACSDGAVLVQGESGTGKELIAGAIHYNSERRHKQLITVNCSALPENLLESELFGHIKGAYTGAIQTRIGRFEEAGDSTIFLDEIGELSPMMQVKLLRVLQEKEIERVGESVKRKVNIRVVAATHQNLQEQVRQGRFREDLYYRLNVFPIKIPPLRQRREDIPLLVSHFIDKMNTKTGKRVVDASREVMRIFLDHDWPGNVRELENAIEHCFVLCSHDRLEVEDLPESLLHRDQSPVSSSPSMSIPANTKKPGAISREDLTALLDECGWNKAEVARRLGVSRTAVWKYMKKNNIPLQQS
jgi:transcriptional regulator with GAF, ATPase, and Fis domain